MATEDKSSQSSDYMEKILTQLNRSGQKVIIEVDDTGHSRISGETPPKKIWWDWLQLLAALAIPVVIAVGGWWFTAAQSQTSLQVSQDQQQETALQNYLDKMSDLLLTYNLKTSKPGNEVREAARARTLTLLPQLNGKRKAEVIQFLDEAGLITAGSPDGSDLSDPVVGLVNADLSGADLSGVNLGGVDLSGADLSGANLSNANLYEANLGYANLNGADLNGAFLFEAELSGAILSGAKLNGAKLIDANLSCLQLNSANLDCANLNYANLYDVNLNSPNPRCAKNDLVQGRQICADLSRANLSDADLSGANLRFTDLSGVDLSGADLSDANLNYTDLSDADLNGANLSDANLSDATGWTVEQLGKAKYLGGATMPDGSKHP